MENQHPDKFTFKGKYWLTRIILLRYLGFVYFTAFLIALNQNTYLIGPNGLLPAKDHLGQLESHIPGGLWERISRVPTVFWVLPERGSASELALVALVGLGLSFIVMVHGAANMLIMAALWGLYHSLVNVGQAWYSFGWESQLLETGFLAIFLCPLLSLKRFPEHSPPRIVVMWGYRWLIFRIMLGAGLIKIRGDQCWLDLTCMVYHYETQPVPNPLSIYLHQAPRQWHLVETLVNHIIELLLPWLLLMTRGFRIWGGIFQISFQAVLISSGNLSFLNWLTILPSLSCFDDESLRWIFTKHALAKVILAARHSEERKKTWCHFFRRSVWTAVSASLFVLITVLSVPVVSNLLSERQSMNSSFDSLRLVNTYGAFGSVTKERNEVILLGTKDEVLTPKTEWKEYEFKCKPGAVDRRPCLISPYHYRLDWLMWFAAFQNYQMNPWLIHLSAKLLCGDKNVTNLIAHDPFEDSAPKYIKADLYRYRYPPLKGTASSDSNAEGIWWLRSKSNEYFPPLHLNNPSVVQFLAEHGIKFSC